MILLLFIICIVNLITFYNVDYKYPLVELKS